MHVFISTVYPKKYAHGVVVLCFVVVMQSFIMKSYEVFIHIHQGCFAGTEAIVRLPQCQWSKPDGYGKISQCITTTKHSKQKPCAYFLGYTVYSAGTARAEKKVNNVSRVFCFVLCLCWCLFVNAVYGRIENLRRKSCTEKNVFISLQVASVIKQYSFLVQWGKPDEYESTWWLNPSRTT